MRMNGLIHAHSGLRWIALVLLLISVVNAFSKKRKNSFTQSDKKLYLFTLISIHLQLVIGLVLYFISPLVNFAHLFDNKILRFFGMEHALGMLIAITLFTIGYIKSKSATEPNKKHSIVATYFLIALLLILIMVPWPFRNFGNGWF
jgi:hypothetical protein